LLPFAAAAQLACSLRFAIGNAGAFDLARDEEVIAAVRGASRARPPGLTPVLWLNVAQEIVCRAAASADRSALSLSPGGNGAVLQKFPTPHVDGTALQVGAGASGQIAGIAPRKVAAPRAIDERSAVLIGVLSTRGAD
jgi:hypothetical protein